MIKTQKGKYNNKEWQEVPLIKAGQIVLLSALMFFMVLLVTGIIIGLE